jgi:phthiocerol/phenolphthiocerol synthesis type-I polyketide synthase E
MSADSTQLADGIAVIGMAGKFPGAPNLAAYWENLRNGVESITRFSEHELEVSPAISQNPQYVRARGIMEGVDLFDADFFNINPREAEYTDPQHRLLLETAWEALENAGYDTERFAGSIGVFAGCSQNTYLLCNLASHPGFLTEFLSFQQMGAHPSMLGNDKDFVATRIAYKMNLRGPSIAVQCACSTSLVAVVQACQNLLTFQCDLALAGGVSVTFPQKRGYVAEEGSLASSEGRCRPFDAAAGGTVFGDGVGLVVLKRADEAIRDGDHIHAVIRGFAVNNDGSTKVSYMAPSVDGQAEAIATAQALAGIDVATIRYVEAHGTGTSLGDPIEVAALTKAFRAGTSERQFCALSAVKGNIGHLEAASGVAGLIKAILALEHGEIPPTLHFSAPNPRIDFAASPFYVCSKLQAWPASEIPRRAGVSSFGVGGTNAHIVLEEAPKASVSSASTQPQLLVLSAKSESALEDATNRLAEYLRGNPEISMADAAYTLQVGRRVFRHRRVWVSRTAEETVELLGTKKSGKVLSSDTQNRKGSVALLFPGQGAQQVDMGRELYETHPIFRAQVDLCCERLAPELGLDLRDVLYPADDADKIEAQDRLMQTSLTQPALFVVEYALAQVWLSLGVRPQVMIGHSLGEYVAAVLAGIFTLEDALHLLAVRGRLIQTMPSGTMLAVVLPEKEVTSLLEDGLSLAAVNGPKLCVVSGPEETVAALRAKLSGQGTVNRELKTSHAFHSAMMEPILAEFEAEVRRVPRNKPQIAIVSSLYGRVATDEEWTDPGYWSAQLRHTVRFADAVSTLLNQPDLALLEVGPGQTLTTLARQNSAKQPGQITNQATIYSSPRTCKESEVAEFLSAAGQLWLAGVEIDWRALHSGAARRRVPLPTYPFERKRHWIEPYASANTGVRYTNGSGAARDMNATLADHLEAMVKGVQVTEGAAEPSSEVEALIQEQLRIMAKQIEVLRHMPTSASASTDQNGAPSHE